MPLRRYRTLRSNAAREIEAEIAAHLELRAADNLRAGLSPSDASRDAIARFGDQRLIARECLEITGQHPAHWFPRFIAFGAPLVALFALLTVTVTMINSTLFAPLRFDASEELVRVGEGWDDARVSASDFSVWRQQSSVFDKLTTFDAGVVAVGLNRPGAPGITPLQCMFVGAAYFDVFRLTPVIGRSFTPEETKQLRANVVVISERLWAIEFNGSPSVLGMTISVGGIPHTIVGVMNEDAQLSHHVDMWRPLPIAGKFAASNHFVVGRLASGETLEAAKTEVARIARSIPLPTLVNDGTVAPLYPLRRLYETGVRPIVMAYAGACLTLLVLIFSVVARAIRIQLKHPDWAISASAPVGFSQPGFVLAAAILGLIVGVQLRAIAIHDMLGRMGTLFDERFSPLVPTIVLGAALCYVAGHAVLIRHTNREMRSWQSLESRSGFNLLPPA